MVCVLNVVFDNVLIFFFGSFFDVSMIDCIMNDSCYETARESCDNLTGVGSDSNDCLIQSHSIVMLDKVELCCTY